MMDSEAAHLQVRVKELERELRDAQLRAGAYEDLLAQAGQEALRVIGCSRRSIDKAVYDRKWKEEIHIARVVKASTLRAVDAIVGALTGDPNEGIVTLEDLQFVTRERISSIAGVGPRCMELLDAGMSKYGLNWADDRGAPIPTNVRVLPTQAPEAMAA